MIALDPEEIFGSAIWDTVCRALSLLACLFAGSFCAFLAVGVGEVLSTLIFSGFSYLAFDGDIVGLLFLLPFWSFASPWAFLAMPNLFVAAVYFFKTEDPTRSKFMTFATLHQVTTAGFLAVSILNLPSGWGLLSTILNVLFYLLLQAATWCGLSFATRFYKTRKVVSHEEHLMGVAAKNAVWRHKVENAEVIPPPPSGPQGPKARPVRGD